MLYKKISSFMLILREKIEKFDLVMEALGRDPNVKSLNLNLAKLKLQKMVPSLLINFLKRQIKTSMLLVM